MPGKPLPQFVAPMQASSVKKPFDSPDWIFETKLDGYRAIAVIGSAGKARIWSRNRLPLEPKFPTIRDAAEELNLRSTILDGEIVALDEEGIPRFQLLQKWQKRPTAPVVYVLFDLVWDNGRDLTGKRVIQRRERLQEIITPVAGIQVGGYLEKRGVDLFNLAKEKGLEGIIAKRKRSSYQSGKRSADWLKIKSRPQQDVEESYRPLNKEDVPQFVHSRSPTENIMLPEHDQPISKRPRRLGRGPRSIHSIMSSTETSCQPPICNGRS